MHLKFLSNYCFKKRLSIFFWFSHDINISYFCSLEFIFFSSIALVSVQIPKKYHQKTQRLFSTQTINIASFGGCCPHTLYPLFAIQPIYFARLPQALFATKWLWASLFRSVTKQLRSSLLCIACTLVVLWKLPKNHYTLINIQDFNNINTVILIFPTIIISMIYHPFPNATNFAFPLDVYCQRNNKHILKLNTL